MSKQELVDKVYSMLGKAKFAQWYEQDFIDHIASYDGAKTKEQIMQELSRMIGEQ